MGAHRDRADEQLVAAVLDGDQAAFSELFDRWFDRVHDVARNIVRDPDVAADVAQDTFVAVWERLHQLERHDAFGGWVLRTARNRALNRLERERRSRPMEGDVVTGLHDRGAPDPVGSHRTLDPDELVAAKDRDGLVHAAAVALGERDASLLDLHLRHGLTPAEIAEELGVPANTAHQQLFRMRNRLGDAVGAFVLWRGGRPACASLAAAVDGGDEFDLDVLAAIERHRRHCGDCDARRRRLVAADQLFTALPVVVVSSAVRDRVHTAVRGAIGYGAAGSAVDSSLERPEAPGSGAGPGPAPGSDDAPADAVSANASTGSEVAMQRRRRLVAGAIVAAAVIVPVAIAVVVWSLRADDDRAGSIASEPVPAASRDDAATEPIGAAAGDGVVEIDLADAVGATAAPATGTDGRALDAPRAGPSAGAPVDGGDPLPPSGNDAPTSLEPSQPLAPPGGGGPDAPAGGGAPGGAVPVPPTSTGGGALPPPTTAPSPAVVTSTSPQPTSVPATTSAPTTSVVPATTVAPPVTATTLPVTTVPTTTQPPAVPKITGFTVGPGPGGVICAIANQAPRRFEWTSVNATTGTLVVAGVVRHVAASGSAEFCAASGSLADLTVSGPGGSHSASLTVP